MTEHYGKLPSEIMADENLQCRQIVKEIMNFGVNQRQIWYVMYLLAMELENIDDLKMATDFIKEYKGSTVFMTLTE